VFDCDSPLLKNYCKAMGRRKYFEGEFSMPKPVTAAGLVDLSTVELSFKHSRSKRSLSVFCDNDAESLPPPDGHCKMSQITATANKMLDLRLHRTKGRVRRCRTTR
jgi:hypothetical protein